MASKSTRIIILLVIDSIFFLIELITGYAVHSLALVADSFHMLNDVLSLCVGLWAVKVANSKGSSKMYTYGWQRAETLGALVNGVFLIALCVTIFLDAIQRFVEPQEVSQPQLVLIIGCLGLASNIVGLFLFHDHGHGGHSHGHSHGAEGHTHSHDIRDAEEGHAHSHSHEEEEHGVGDESGNVVDVLPQNRIAGWPTTRTEGSDATAVDVGTPGKRSKQRHSRTGSRYSALDELPINPGQFRQSIIVASTQMDSTGENEEEDGEAEEEAILTKTTDATHNHHHQHRHDGEGAPLLNGATKGYGSTDRSPSEHREHNHRKAKTEGKGGHSHDDLNMRGIFLHVMGDALGNLGVIATALFIWLTDYSWRFYFDPAISLVITVIILCSAIPLCKAASRILLQAVPHGLSVDDIQEDIQDLDGILSCHDVHIWQLSDTRYVASLHVKVDFDFKGEGAARYMQLAENIKKCLHEFGIHSSTIQPEFCLDPDHDHSSNPDTSAELGEGAISTTRFGTGGSSKAASVRDQACLLGCSDNCASGQGCCDPPTKDAHDGHGHAH